MLCPNCRQPMSKRDVDTVTVDHCDFCGGTFFDSYEINRISKSSASYLSKTRKSDSISGGQKFCPADQSLLVPVEHDSVPTSVTLLKCPKCHGIFTFPDDLVQFKELQGAKLSRITAWYKPAPALSKVFVMSFVAAIAASVLYGSYITRQAPTTVADESVCTPSVLNTDATTTIYCSTDFEFSRSEALFQDRATGEVIIRPINDTPSKTHILTVSHEDVAPNPDRCVLMRLYSDSSHLDTQCVPLMQSP